MKSHFTVGWIKIKSKNKIKSSENFKHFHFLKNKTKKRMNKWSSISNRVLLYNNQLEKIFIQFLVVQSISNSDTNFQDTT